MNQSNKSLERYTNRDHESMKICQSPVKYLKMLKKNKGSKIFPSFPSDKRSFNILLEDIRNLYRLGAANSNKDIKVYKSISRAELDMFEQGEININYFTSTSDSQDAVLEYGNSRHITRIVEFEVIGVDNIEVKKQNVFLIAPEEEEVILIPPFTMTGFKEIHSERSSKRSSYIL